VRTAALAAAVGYRAAMDELAFQRALESLWRLLAETNQYLVAHEPWRLIKAEGPTPKLARVLWNSLEATRIVAVGLLPIMPRAAVRVLHAIGAPVPGSLDAMAWGGTPTGALLPPPSPIFPRIDKEAYVAEAKQTPAVPSGAAAPSQAAPAAAPAAAAAVAAPTAPAAPTAVAALTEPAAGATAPPAAAAAVAPATAQIPIERFKEIQLRVATVRQAEPVPKSKKLLKLTVDLGGQTRTVVAGIAQAYRPEELLGKQVIVVANLAPATLMGVESQGMVLAASTDGSPVLLHPAHEVPAGTEVR